MDAGERALSPLLQLQAGWSLKILTLSNYDSFSWKEIPQHSMSKNFAMSVPRTRHCGALCHQCHHGNMGKSVRLMIKIDCLYKENCPYTGKGSCRPSMEKLVSFATVPPFDSGSGRHDHQPTTQHPHLMSSTSTGRGYSMSLATLIVLSAIHTGDRACDASRTTTVINTAAFADSSCLMLSPSTS